MPQHKRILLVEDHDDTRRALKLLLQRESCEVLDYDHCAPAEVHMKGCDVDIALLDVRLPGRSGDDFGRELRERCPKMMIVFVTGEPFLESLKQAVPDCFILPKPVTPDALMKMVNRGNASNG